MSYLMDYGHEEPFTPARPRRWPLLRRCVITIVTYTVIAVSGLLALHIREAIGPTYRLDMTPDAGITAPARH